MLHEKLRIAPTCYHVLHQVPVMTAHEMNFLYDEGLRNAAGSPAYEILHDSMVPFGLGKLGISQAMKEKSVDIALDVQSRTVFFQRARGADLYIIAGWRNQHTNVWVAPPHIKSLTDLKGKRVGISDFNSIRHWAIQIQLKKAGLDLVRDVPKNYEYINHLEKRLRLLSPDPEERLVTNASRTQRDLEAMPFPIDGLATGFEDMLKEEERLGELNYDVPAIKDVCAQDLAKEAFKELMQREELAPEYQRVRAVAERWGY